MCHTSKQQPPLPLLEALVLQCWNSDTEYTIELASLKSISMPKLQLLHLDCARLSAVRFSCSVLTSLTLRKCTLLGASFAECLQLQHLTIQNAYLGPIAEAGWLTVQLQSLKTLQYLKLEHCHLSAVPNSLSTLVGLQVLNVRSNTLEGLLGLPSTLRQLQLGDNCFDRVPRELYSMHAC